MNIRQSLEIARQALADAGIPDARPESEVLLACVLGVDRARLLLEPDRLMSQNQSVEYRSVLERRLTGEPTPYITGHSEFHGLYFILTPDVFIPRPETEVLVDKAIAVCRDRHLHAIVDVGTGSGIVAICLALNLPEATVCATDISAAALDIARRNCEKHGVPGRVKLALGDMLEPAPAHVDAIVANMPYVRTMNCLGAPEPVVSLDGGPDGTDRIRRLCRQAAARLKPHGALLLEMAGAQCAPMASFLEGLFPESAITVVNDQHGIARVVCLELAG